MKSTVKFLKFTVCVIVLALIVSVPLAAHSKDKIIIGQAVSLTGPLGPSSSFVSAPYYDFWVKVVNAEGGIFVKEYGKKLPVELFIYDDKSDIGTMTRLLEKLILVDKVDFLLPPWSTAFHFAAAPVINKHKYILIGGAGGAMKLKDFSAELPYYFQTLNFAETQVPTLVEILKELGVKKVAIIYHDDLHGAEYTEAAVPALTDGGFEIVMKKSYSMGVKDLSLQLKQAKSLNADAFIGFSYPDEVMLITGQAIGLGIDFKVFGCREAMTPTLLTLLIWTRLLWSRRRRTDQSARTCVSRDVDSSWAGRLWPLTVLPSRPASCSCQPLSPGERTMPV